MTTQTSVLDSRNPRRTAVESPRSSVLSITRTGYCDAIARTRSAVPSFEASSTKTISTSGSAAQIRRTRGSTLSASLKVGTTTVARARTPVAGSPPFTLSGAVMNPTSLGSSSPDCKRGRMVAAGGEEEEVRGGSAPAAEMGARHGDPHRLHEAAEALQQEGDPPPRTLLGS